MPLLDADDPRPVHFVGIAGAGMSALAELFVRRRMRVTGCDAHATSVGDLRALGVDVREGHDPTHVDGSRALVVTSALAKQHPEVVRARELGLPVVRRAEALAEAVSGGTLIAIAGTHGKTTTTVMTTDALAAAGRDPTGVVGGRVAAWGGNLRAGGEDVFVVEADEYDRSFLALAPTVAVVTNLEADHLDIYADLADIRSAFGTFVGGARVVVACADDPGSATLPVPRTAETIRYGLTARDARLVGRDPTTTAQGSRCSVVLDGKMLGPLALRVPGEHNLRNALAAIASGLALGVTLDAMRPGLEAFTGVERRFQRLGTAGGVVVVDDYAHHPTEIAATLAAARSAYPGRRLIAAFQPHLFSRTRDFAAEFAGALAAADAVFLTEIYPAREQPLPGVTAALIAAPLERAGARVAWRGERAALAQALAKFASDGDVVLTIGAGDVTRTGPELLALLAPAPARAS
ncbi:MAG: UDP-N-acetylmuramate--L-alanine ligase [Gemmatimonadaceae bacterium]